MEDKEIRKVFNTVMAIVHAMPKTKSGYFPLAMDKEEDSYYETPKHKECTALSLIDLSSASTISRTVENMFLNRGSAELLPIANAIGHLANTLNKKQKEQSPEVAPYIYTMY